jgi:recombination protein RecR
MSSPSKYLDALIKEFSRLPGMGQKSASRAAFHILKISKDDARRFSEAIIALKDNIKTCSSCGGISDADTCDICRNERRDHSLVCVVENQKDVLTIEKTGAYGGVYFVLGGVISPLDGIGPDELNMKPLLEKCMSGFVRELIIAINPTIEGDATTLYISKILKGLTVKIMRIARGLPVGSDIEFADSATIARSLTERTEV